MAPVKPSAQRIARLRALAAMHDEWVERHLADADFAPEGRPTPSDYNLHFLDVNPPSAAEDEFHRRARRIMGLDAS